MIQIEIMLTFLEEKILENIITEFGSENLSYACVAKELGMVTEKPHIHMQIILKRPVNKTSWFMDKFTSMNLYNIKSIGSNAFYMESFKTHIVIIKWQEITWLGEIIFKKVGSFETFDYG